ncbi:hypothetical protein ABOM_003304 [Aspergillus bombycis]|uniref:F-box domain-containing protein n=1 Tax=Aspergillus bombycis TaxID=109264 RepID=A0A1F8A7Y9_9EURO|nr:hypothetical protein ABOM_003304 [Aspergillus bombycis]OGM47793.1 hypothetical protein ABOM_003304 [Aspergillus bombycis]
MDRLPNELLLLLRQYFDDDILTKLVLSNCSHRLQSLFDPPRVYSSLHLSCIGARELQLIQHLLRRPDLARLVHHAYFGIERSYPPDSGYRSGACYPRCNSIIKHMVEEICEFENEKCWWAAHLRDFSDDAWLGALLTRLNNLRSITLAYGDQGFMNSIFDKAASRQGPFRTTTPFPLLQKVTLTNNCSWFQCTSGYPRGLFHLPAVRTIEGVRVWGSVPCCDSWDFCGVKGRTSPVTELVMSPVYGCQDMGDWIAACSKLERLQVDIGIMQYLNYIFDPIAFRKCLVPCIKTLKDLSLTFHISYQEDRALQRGGEIYLHLLRDDLLCQRMWVS